MFILTKDHQNIPLFDMMELGMKKTSNYQKVLCSDLAFKELPSGGMLVLKDRYEIYGTDKIYFAE